MSERVYTPSAEFAELAAEYEIIGELGRGGNAVVYRARDRGLGREVAIKVVHPRPLTPEDDAVARLAREARTIAQLQHPNIVTVYAVRRLSGGGLALIMQLVPGRTLKAVVLQDGALDAERCQRILRDVASALAYAHSRGVIHRDVKPENVFLDELTDRVLLADFGIARSLEQDSGTMTGTAIGTPFYMSPEQIDGAAVDGRSDLYSLGLVAWELLTGRRPWDGESLYNVIYKQKHEELPPIEALRPGVSLRLQYVIERMLQKKPSARWAGADGLLTQLSHSVLPGDYSRWQAALRRRVARHQAAERERARAPSPAANGGGLLASTMRFVRGSATDPGSAQLAHTALVPLQPGQSPPLGDPHSIDSPPTYIDTETETEPSWTEPSAPTSRWRMRVAAGVLVAAAIGIAAVGPQIVRSDRGRARTPASAVVRTIAPSVVAPSDSSSRDTVIASMEPVTKPVARPAAMLATREAAPAVLALGARHSCVVDAAGVVLCWGANDRGQLGDGTAIRQSSPARISADLAFNVVAAGAAHTCGVTRLGDVYCWGSDSRGQLGDATTVRRNAPVRVAGPGVYRSVAAGDAHTCAITVEGTIDCWGANDRGQLGDGTTRSRNTPRPVSGLPDGRFVELVAGAAHTCARTDVGATYCWGANERGQVGVAGADRLTPIPVDDPSRFVSLGAGAAHTCGATIDGVVRCWGANARGQLGASALSAAPRAVRLEAPAMRVAAGSQHTCALLSDGRLVCWGANGAGQLGTLRDANALPPSPVASPARYVAVAAGGAHTCAVTITGIPVCWGDNAEGQVGGGVRTSRRGPNVVTVDSTASPSPAPQSTAR